MSFKTPILCDRRVYTFKGKWQNPQQDIHSNIYYFIKEYPTLVPTYTNGREELVETLTITCFGSHPFCKEDDITLENGKTYKIHEILPINYEPNILVRDMLKPRYASVDLVLE